MSVEQIGAYTTWDRASRRLGDHTLDCHECRGYLVKPCGPGTALMDIELVAYRALLTEREEISKEAAPQPAVPHGQADGRQ